jgi:glycosyltransferase involved in cell wall biosynthesis
MSSEPATRQKILMLAPQLGYGGAERVFVRLAVLLALRHDVTVALFTPTYPSGHAHESYELSVPVVVLDRPEGEPRLRRWWRRWRMLRNLKSQNDVAISFLTGPSLLNVLTPGRAKTILSYHGSRRFDPEMSAFERVIYGYLLDPLAFILAGRIHTVAAGITNEFRAKLPEKFASKFSTIEVFLDSNAMIERAREPIEAEIHVLSGQPLLVAVGRLAKQKGFTFLLDVFADVLQHQLDAKLLIIGDGPLEGELRGRCQSLGIPTDDLSAGVGSVIFLGYRKDPIRYLRLGKAFVLSSLHEGFPNVIMEALAAETLVIAADAPWGARSVLCQRETEPSTPYPTNDVDEVDYGLLLPRIDAPEFRHVWVATLLHVLREPSRYAKVAAKGPQRVAQLDAANLGNKWFNMIEKLQSSAPLSK